MSLRYKEYILLTVISLLTVLLFVYSYYSFRLIISRNQRIYKPKKQCTLFLKFHKTASATVGKILRQKFGTDWWIVNKICGASAFHEHSTLQLFRKVENKKAIFEKCVAKEHTTCDTLEVTTLLRHPLEKIVSQLFFFQYDLKRAVPHLLNNTVTLLLNNPKNISAEQMKILLIESQNYFNKNNENDPWQNLNLNEYLFTLGRLKNITYLPKINELENEANELLNISLDTIRKDIDIIGVME